MFDKNLFVPRQLDDLIWFGFFGFGFFLQVLLGVLV